jgi:hypothetical protein
VILYKYQIKQKAKYKLRRAAMNEKNFSMNEYLDVNISQELMAICSACYRKLGWSIIDTRSSIRTITIKLERDYKIKNRAELYDLQRECEKAFEVIEGLEKSKTRNARAVSLGIGVMGTVFMACSVFAYLAGKLSLCVIFAIPGFTGWLLPYFVYRKIKEKTINRVMPRIDQNYNIIYEACEKAHSLLN